VDEDRRSGEDGGGGALNGRADATSPPEEPRPEPLPNSMRRRLDQCADQWLREHGTNGPEATGSGSLALQSTGRRHFSWVPWSVAGACLGLALLAWIPRLSDPGRFVVAGHVAQWRLQAAREHMLAGSPRVGLWRWAGGEGEGAGDVVWDNRRQQGFLRLRGFVANDPARARYQLWIFDAARDERYPVDGGLFDVPAGFDEVVIPAKASLPVVRPAAFAVTVEKPGGAVVSEREKVVAFARAED